MYRKGYACAGGPGGKAPWSGAVVAKAAEPCWSRADRDRRLSTVVRIAIIGAGIGGVSAAVALHQAGCEVDVYEQAPELTEVGGGINMGPNAVRVLRRLGLGPGLDREGVRPIGTHQRRWQDGRTLQKGALHPQ